MLLQMAELHLLLFSCICVGDVEGGKDNDIETFRYICDAALYE